MSLERVDWINFFDQVEHQPPRNTLLKALELFEGENKRQGTAIDLGFGAGNDTTELLKQDWKVIAIDGVKQASDRLWKKIGKNKNLKTITATFEGVDLEQCDLLNASFALPFCHPDHFDQLWDKITNSIIVGGRFAGHLFGDRDERTKHDSMTAKTKEEVDLMFMDFEIEHFEIDERDGELATGAKQHIHLFEIVARKLC